MPLTIVSRHQESRHLGSLYFAIDSLVYSSTFLTIDLPLVQTPLEVATAGVTELRRSKLFHSCAAYHLCVKTGDFKATLKYGPVLYYSHFAYEEIEVLVLDDILLKNKNLCHFYTGTFTIATGNEDALILD